MSRSVANRKAWKDDHGAYMVLTAVLVPAVVFLGALTFGTTSLWTVHDDLQRSSDLGAAAGAAAVPAVAVTPGAAYMPFPLDGTSVTQSASDVLGPLAPGDWKHQPCHVAWSELDAAQGRSAVTNAFSSNLSESLCTPDWKYESPTLAAAAACAGNLLDVPNCGSTFRNVLTSRLPGLNSSFTNATAAMDAAKSQVTQFTDPATKLVTDQVASLLADACAVEITVPLTGVVCSQTVSQLLGGAAPWQVTKFGVSLEDLLPAVVTPRVNVQFNGARVRPAFSPWRFSAGSTATPRGTIKSALVLPGACIPISSVTSELQAPLGPDAPSLQQAVPDPVEDCVINPNDLNRTAQSSFDFLRTSTLNLFGQVNKTIGDPVVQSFMTAACGLSPISIECPNMNPALATDDIDGQFVQDFRDATRPPPAGADEPTLNQLLEDYYVSRQPVTFVSGLSPTNMPQLFGQTVWSVLTDPRVNPVLAPLLSPLMYVPAVDVVPATVGRITLPSDPANPYFVLQPIPWSDTLALKGLFQARLVK